MAVAAPVTSAAGLAAVVTVGCVAVTFITARYPLFVSRFTLLASALCLIQNHLFTHPLTATSMPSSENEKRET
jgi:hypothetical protein